MRILILGAGAVGLSLAARLSSYCEEVQAVCRPRHAEAIARHGFKMNGIWGDGTYRIHATTEVSGGHPFDYCIVTSKSLDTREICETNRRHLEGCQLVSLQNGIGNEEILAEFSPLVIGGTIITGFEWRGDGQVHVTVEAGPIRLGRFPAGSDEPVQRLVALFARAGLPVEESHEIRGNLWAKTLYNCALNPLGAILDVPYGELSAEPSWKLITGIIEEAFAVCGKEGVKLPWESAGEYLAYLKDTQLPATAGHHSSMLQDLRNGRKTEIDFINGAVCRLGRLHGIATPVNQTLVELIRFKSPG
jgi:2-dehydropantoate 2-reductase